MTWNDAGKFIAEWSILAVVVVGLLVLNVGSLRRRRYQKFLRARRGRVARTEAGTPGYRGGVGRKAQEPRLTVIYGSGAEQRLERAS